MGTTHSFSVHYNINTDEYCLLTFASGNTVKAVCYVPASAIKSACDNRNIQDCLRLEKYSNTGDYLNTTASVSIPPVLIDKYFLISPKNNTTSGNKPAVFDIRTGKEVSPGDNYETFNLLKDSLVVGSNIKFISADTLPTMPNSTNYALYNKDVDLRIS